MSRAAVSLFDYETGRAWADAGDRWFHAASTIKIAILACVFRTLEEQGLPANHRLAVENRFTSALDGAPYAVPVSRDSDPALHSEIGRPLPAGELAHRMIAVSSNLATNVLLQFVGVPHARRILADAGVTGVDLVRGVEDDRAFDAGLWNRVTANGLIALLRALYEQRFASSEGTAAMIEILGAQTFNQGIPAGLPPPVRATARVAHKTGEISTATHDAGLVFLPGRAPYVLSILTDRGAEAGNRYAPIAEISAAVYEQLQREVMKSGGPDVHERQQ